MKNRIWKLVIAYVGLALIVVPSLLVFRGQLTTETSKMLMAAGTLIWFVFYGTATYKKGI